ncbi:hypothetical protein B0H14DRAFT_2580626 [Mycena olivaceomarginata]|nr:hypothetical protein B0H14DRAFT_2580626 [Mycena olivaceomarginata]
MCAMGKIRRKLLLRWILGSRIVGKSSSQPIYIHKRDPIRFQTDRMAVSLPLFVNHNFPQLGPEDFFEAEIPQAVATLPKSYMPPLPPSAAREPAHGSPKSKSPSTLSDTILHTVQHLTLNKPNIAPNSSEGKRKLQDQKEHDDDSDSDAGDSDRERRRRERKKTHQPRSRKPKTTPEQRQNILLEDPHTVKSLPGVLKGDAQGVYCACTPGRIVKLEKTKLYILKNWESHQKTCPLVTGIQPEVTKTAISCYCGSTSTERRLILHPIIFLSASFDIPDMPEVESFPWQEYPNYNTTNPLLMDHPSL